MALFNLITEAVTSFVRPLIQGSTPPSPQPTAQQQPIELSNTKSIIQWLENYYRQNNFEIQELNLIGIRDTSNIQQDVINDWIGFWTKETFFLTKGTTDPSVFWTTDKSRNSQGTFHLLCGFHSRIWIVGTHAEGRAGAHEALVNRWEHCRPTRGWRDANYNFTRDPEDVEVSGYFGINLHRMHATQIATRIGRYSAGCQVVQHPQHFAKLLQTVKKTKMYKSNRNAAFNYCLFNIVNMPNNIMTSMIEERHV
jgi:hypothetical protein